MNDIERAISEISEIRTQLAASMRFRGYAPEAVALMGLLSLAFLLAQLAFPEALAASSLQISLAWGGLLLINAFAIAVETVVWSWRQSPGMAGAMLRGAMLTTIPISFASLVIGVVVAVYVPDAAWILPGIWQMLVGVVGFSSHAILPRGIIWPALWYTLCGAGVTAVAATTGEISPLLAGIPFIVGHLWIALILHRDRKIPS